MFEYLTQLDSSTATSAIFTFVICFLWLSEIFDLYISWRQYSVLNKKNRIPDMLKGHFTEESFEKSRLYEIRNYRFSFIKSIYQLIFNTTMLYILFDYKIYMLAKDVINKIGLDGENQIFTTLSFLIIESLFSHILNIPWSLYKHFVIEEEFGFNKLTLSFYFKDSIKSLLLKIIISSILFSIIIKIIILTGPNLYLYTSVAILLFQIFFLTIYQDYIAPLFDNFIQMPSDSSLKQDIDRLASEQKFPLKNVLVIEGSKRSAHSNAYFIGLFGKKTIVLFDTLLAESPFKKQEDGVGKPNEMKPCTDREILAILAHELGHWKFMHILKNMVLGLAQTFLTFFVFAKLIGYSPLYQAFGFSMDGNDSKPIIIGLSVVMQYILGPLNIIFGFLMTFISRKFEFEADFFSQQLGYTDDLITSLSKLQVNNLSYPIYDNLYSLLNHSHPPILQRLQNLIDMSKKKTD